MAVAQQVAACHWTISDPTAIARACAGAFSAPGAPEIVVVRGHNVDLLRVEGTDVRLVASTPVFAAVRSVAALPVDGSVDHLVVATDAGRLALLRFDGAAFVRRRCDTFAKTGLRRCVAGDYMAVDPQGRAVMLCASEKGRLVFPVSKDGEGEPTFKSPLEANSSGSVIYGCVAVDNAGPNALFACLERDMASGEKALAVYEYDAGLHHVVRRWSFPVPATASAVFSLPASAANAGVILVSAGFDIIALRHDGHRVLRYDCAAPRRQDHPLQQGPLHFVAAAAIRIRQSGFALVQNELGDLFQVTAAGRADGELSLGMRYFDTVPVATALALVRCGGRGLLFAAADCADHSLYAIVSDGYANDAYVRRRFHVTHEGKRSTVGLFERHLTARHLDLVDTIRNHGPLTAAVAAPGSDGGLAFVGGRLGTGHVATLARGHATTGLLELQLPPGTATVHAAGAGHVLVSTAEATAVFEADPSRHERLVERREGDGFVTSEPTLAAGALADEAGVLQVHRGGLRHKRAQGANDWAHALGKKVAVAAVAERQVLVAYEKGGVDLFELGGGDVLRIATSESEYEAADLCIAPAAGATLSSFGGVVYHATREFTVMWLERSRRPLSSVGKKLTCAYPPVSAEMAVFADGRLTALVGLEDGTVVQLTVDSDAGTLLSCREHKLGAAPCRVLPGIPESLHRYVVVEGRVLRATVDDGCVRFRPVVLPQEAMPVAAAADIAGASFAVLGAKAPVLRLCTLDPSPLHVERVPLPGCVPRRVASHPTLPLLLCLSSEHRGLTPEARALLDGSDAQPSPGSAGFFAWRLQCVNAGAVARGVVDEVSGQHIGAAPESSEAAVSLCVATFAKHRGLVTAVVGVVPNHRVGTPTPDPANLPALHCVVVETDGRLRLQHTTTVDDVPLALLPFAGGLVVGAGPDLRFYVMGERQLLRQTTVAAVPHRVVALAAEGDVIAACDAHESVHFLRHHRTATTPLFTVFADDAVPRRLTACCFVDPVTVAVADRFGTVALLRLSAAVVAASSVPPDDEAATATQWGAGKGAPHKASLVASFHVGTAVTHLHRSDGAVVYCGVNGAVGALIPVSAADGEYLRAAETALDAAVLPVVGRAHQRYRGSFEPVRGVVDGDFIQACLRALPPGEAAAVAEDVASSAVRVKAAHDIAGDPRTPDAVLQTLRGRLPFQS